MPLPAWMEQYLQLAFCLIPIRHHLHTGSCTRDCKLDKEPLVNWKEYQTRQPSREELQEWLRIHPDSDWAVVCGQVSGGLSILDFDSMANYKRFFNAEKIEREAPVVATRRGVHVWVRSDRSVRKFKIEGLVEVQAEGGYAKVPPSIHGSGVEYRFVNSVREPLLISNLELSVWERAEKLGFKKKRVKEIGSPRSLKGSGYVPNCIATLSQGAKEGNRSDAAIHLASYWQNMRELSSEDTWQWLLEWNKKNEPPLDERELQQVLESAARGGYVYGCCVESSEAGTLPHEAAEYILSTTRIKTLTDTDEILIWNGVYHPGAETVIAGAVAEKFHTAQLDHLANNHFHNELLGYIRRFTYVDRKLFDVDPYILNLENCLLDLRDLTVKPHAAEHLSLVQLPVRYDPAVDCPRWKEFVSQVLHPDDFPAVQEFVGSLLWKEYKTQKAWLQWGEGANGKDTFDRVLVALLGLENVSGRSLQDLEENRFARADLYGRLANIHSDLPDRALKTTGAFKTLTGEGLLAAERKFQNAFNFANYAKLIFACNKIPLSPDDTDAFFRRWFITAFPNRFLGDKANPNLVAKLTTPEELSGILNWALEGLRRLRAQNWQFSNSRSVEDVRDEYIRKSDPVKAFALECCLPDPEGSVPKQSLFQAFVRYCELRKLPVVTDDTFFKRLPMAGIPISSAKLGPVGSRVPSFKGLWLRRIGNWGKEAEEDEKPLTDQTLIDLDLRREKSGQGGHPGHGTGVMSSLSTLSGGPPPKVEVATGQQSPDLATLRDFILKALPAFKQRFGYATLPQLLYSAQEGFGNGVDINLVRSVIESLEHDGLVMQPRPGQYEGVR